MSTFGVLRLPASVMDRGTVTLALPPNPNSLDYAGGLTPSSRAFRVVRTPGSTDPMCWTRGSLYGLGYCDVLADAGVAREDVGGGSFYWDAPGAWGKPGAVVRHPRTLLLYTNFVIDDIFDRVDAAFTARLSDLDVSVLASNDGRLTSGALLTRGIPLASVNYQTYDLEVGTGARASGRRFMDISSSVAGTLYRGGKVYVASLLIEGEGLRGYYRTTTWNDPDNPTSPLPPDIDGMSKFVNHYSTPGPGAGASNYVSYVLDQKIAQDLTTLAAAVPRFEAFASVAYTPGLTIPDNTGAELVPAGAFTAALSGPTFRTAQYDPADQDALWQLLLSDAIAFFSS